MEWQNTFELGIEEFDHHHKHLIGLMNNLHDGILSGESIETLGIILDEIGDYTSYHFRAEEDWMEEHMYPGLTWHRDQHSDFVSKVNNFKIDLMSGKMGLPLEVLSFLMTWLTDHILGSDANFRNFAKG